MFENLKTKAAKLSDKNNKNPLAKYFQNPGYVQDSEEREAQVLFFKLLMITAYADESIDDEELDLIKDYAYEHCLTGEEWREIYFFRRSKPSKEEIGLLMDNLISKASSADRRKNLLNAIKDVVNSDDILHDREKEIVELLEEKINISGTSVMSNLIGNIKEKLAIKRKGIFNDRGSKEYSRNPVLPVLARITGKENIKDIEVVSAVLGLAIVLIHADMEFHDKEREAFIELVKTGCGLDDERAEEAAAELLRISDNDFEIAYLGRIIAESTDEERRRKILSSFFKIARADKVYDAYEDKYLKVIAQYLFIGHREFITLKLAGAG
ncbi:MAG: TerB family tellurite resistance protein [Spirochaetes bacterium]|nr:TerB family tellurite resistance protein [Spirochaetota bacterium]